MSLFATKPISKIVAEAQETGEHTLKKTLSALDLTTLGIGAIIGTGIFVLTAEAAQKAGPGMMLSFVIAGFVCAVAALCYAEFAAMALAACCGVRVMYLTGSRTTFSMAKPA